MNAETFGRERQEGPEWYYANCIRVGHNAFKFMMDFGQMQENASTAKFEVRIVGDPPFAKSLWRMLGEAIAEYESTFAAIRERED